MKADSSGCKYKNRRMFCRVDGEVERKLISLNLEQSKQGELMFLYTKYDKIKKSCDN